MEFDHFVLINTYVPNGGPQNVKVPLKLDYLEKLLETVKSLMKKKEILLCGDFNIAHTENDLAQPKQNRGRT